MRIFTRWTEKRIKLTVIVISSASFMAVAALPLICALWWRDAHNLEPLSVPISLKRSLYLSPYFITDQSEEYQIELDWDRFPDAVGDLDLNWRIEDSDGLVRQQGKYRGQIRGGDGLTLVEYQGKRGVRQRIVLEILQDVNAFNAHHPRLDVSLPEEMLASGFVVPIAVLWTTLIVTGGGVAAAIVACRRRPKESETTEQIQARDNARGEQ